jgi:hypothetical protein
MSNVQNVANGAVYALYWATYANRPELVAIPQDNVNKVIRNADRMDYVTLSADAIKAVKAAASTRMDP